MRRAPGGSRRHLLAVPLLLVLGLAGLLGLTGPAWAHTSLVGTEPAAGAELQAPPTELRLTFSEEILPRFLTVRVTVDGNAPEDVPAGAEGAVVTADIPDGVGADLAGDSHWQVDYRVVGSDGHPVTGTIEFSVDAPGTTAEASPTATAGPAASDNRLDLVEESRGDERAGRGFPWLLVGSAMALVLVSVAAGVSRRRG